MPKWKQWLEGVYDKEGLKTSIAVTGSAKLNSYKKIGDSLAGRYFEYRLHPIDIKEYYLYDNSLNPKIVLERLLQLSGFLEPFKKSQKKFYQLWKKTHLNIILRQNLIDLESVSSIKKIELLIDLLPERVGSKISYSSLARDIQVSNKTIKVWLEHLENIYIIFKATPYSKNLARSVLKKPKYYFYDIARIKHESARLENLLACALLKEVHFLQDCVGENAEFIYLEKKGVVEIDFFLKLTASSKLIEMKTRDGSPSKSFYYFRGLTQNQKNIQLVKELKREKTTQDGLEIREMYNWLVNLGKSRMKS